MGVAAFQGILRFGVLGCSGFNIGGLPNFTVLGRRVRGL